VTIRAHILGASGYAGGELIRLLTRHPDAGLATVESASCAGEEVGAVFPELRRIGLRFDGAGAVAANVRAGDAVFCAGTHGAARAAAPALLAAGAKVIDLSDDFRLAERAEAGGTVAVYGLPERYRAQIASARLVANPGCYPTATLLALLPLAEFAGAIEALVIDAKSGITGAGRTPSASSLFAEVDEDVRPYGLTGHRHEPEIAQELAAAGLSAPFTFTPQVVPLRRGMLVCAYAVMRAPAGEDAVRAAYRRAYGGSPFVRLLDGPPSLRAVAWSNDAEIRVSVHGQTVRVLSAIDNLGKGAAGQAVQNFNLMYGLAEERGLQASRGEIRT
jgi:N-acetyl-gamma-glutamyl-phosphate reductase